MTFLGKLFVLVNVAVSLLLAFVAFALYTGGVEWGYDPAKPGQPGGLLKEKQERIKEYQAAQPNVEGSWRTANAQLWATEGSRLSDRAFYASEFDHLRSKADADKPARTVKIENFRPVRTPGGLPEMEEARERGDKDKAAPLLSRAAYDEKLKKAQADNLAVLDDLQDKIRNTTEWTEKMLDGFERKADPGSKDKDLILEPRGPRGLRSLLVLERAKHEGVLEEQRLVRPLFVNTAVESELSFKRVESLEERVKELDAYIKKRKMDAELSRR